MPTGEYLGVACLDLGFTGPEDFEISTTIPRIPGLDYVGQFGLYVGTDSASNIRGGLLSQDQPDRYHLLLVNNYQGIDSEPNEIGLMTTGDDLRLTLAQARRALFPRRRELDPRFLEHTDHHPSRLPRPASKTCSPGSSVPTRRAMSPRR